MSQATTERVPTERVTAQPVSSEPAHPEILGPSGEPAARRRSRVRRILVPLLAVLVVALAAVGFNIYWQGAHYVSTDNAQVGGQPVTVGSMSAGRVAGLHASVGAAVRQGDVLAQIDVPTAVKTLQNGTPDLEFLGSADQIVDVKSPMTGVVIAVPGAIGATVTQGQTLVTLMDPNQLWVTANVDENQVSRLQVGQEADVHLDALNRTVQGTVSELTPATAQVFGLLPQSNTTTNFTKVAQVVPIRVAVELGNSPGLLGSSASVKIRVA
jgi:multidrug resistance efflux pump